MSAILKKLQAIFTKLPENLPAQYSESKNLSPRILLEEMLSDITGWMMIISLSTFQVIANRNQLQFKFIDDFSAIHFSMTYSN